MEDIRGIKPIFDFSDYYQTLFIFLAGVVAIFLLIYLYKKFFTKDKRREQWIQELKSVDLKNPKTAAYQITKYGRSLVKDEKEEELLKTLLNKLEHYKYKKEVSDSLDQETINFYHTFVESIDG